MSIKGRIAFITLGCKANHFDTFSLMDQLRSSFEVVEGEEQADLYVVNTCAVTHRAEAEARKIIRRLKRKNPSAHVLVTGCYAQTSPELLGSLPGVDWVVGNSHKDEIPFYVDAIFSGRKEEPPRLKVSSLKGRGERMPLLPHLSHYREGTRAFLKIQEGCDYACTFCLTTIARGSYRSLPLDTLIRQLEIFEEQGFQEVVLTGIQIGQYGKDLHPPLTLASALKKILRETGIPRYRLTSLDPRTVDDELIELVANEERICPSLHIPAQSGSSAILKRMGRGYTGAWIDSLYRKIRNAIPHCLIGSDIIIGFPGEGPEDFDATCALIEEWIDHVHPFPYSDRPGTPASQFPRKVPPEVIERRMEVVRNLGNRKRQEFQKRLSGTVQRVLVESTSREGRYFGYTDHYVPVYVEGASPGELGMFYLTYEGDLLVGRPVRNLSGV
jgi:threonylcarbamoyladenosine tRNA methylthiotransferase MtaB